MELNCMRKIILNLGYLRNSLRSELKFLNYSKLIFDYIMANLEIKICLLYMCCNFLISNDLNAQKMQ